MRDARTRSQAMAWVVTPLLVLGMTAQPTGSTNRAVTDLAITLEGDSLLLQWENQPGFHKLLLSPTPFSGFQLLDEDPGTVSGTVRSVRVGVDLGERAFFQVRVNEPPTAILPAGPLLAEMGHEFSLMAAGTDPDGDPLDYRWYLGGDLIAEGPMMTRTVPPFEGVYWNFELVANDGHQDSPPASLVVHIIYPVLGGICVTTDGDDANPGTPQLPKRTIAAGIAAAQAAGVRGVFVAEGTYAESVVLVPHLDLWGGYSADYRHRNFDWHETLIQGQNPPTLLAIDLTDVSLSGLHLAGTALGLQITGSSHLTGTDLIIETTPGAEGARGANGSAGAGGGAGNLGQPGCENSDGVFCSLCDQPFGGLGGGTFNRRGGTGGSSGCGPDAGLAGAVGSGPGGGAGGAGGASLQNGGPGANGAPGADGANGLPGTYGTWSWTGYEPSYASYGSPGADGSGGGGGGGGGGGTNGCDSYGSAGGGGGGGGFGGQAGSGGHGGAASIGVWIRNCGDLSLSGLIDVAAGGDGGSGGEGGWGGTGAPGSNGGPYGGSGEQDDGGMGGRGGNGGNGGKGGWGGNGAGGPCVGILTNGHVPSGARTFQLAPPASGGNSPGTPGLAGISAAIYNPWQ